MIDANWKRFHCTKTAQLGSIECSWPSASAYRRCTNGTQAQAEAALTTAGLRHEMVTEPNANHAFFNDTGMSYNAAAAADAWSRLLCLVWRSPELKDGAGGAQRRATQRRNALARNSICVVPGPNRTERPSSWLSEHCWGIGFRGISTYVHRSLGLLGRRAIRWCVE